MNQRDTTYAKWLGIAGGIFLIVAAVLEYWPTTDPLSWVSFEEARGIAAGQNKPMFVDIYAEWCAPCKAMDKEVFPDDSVQSILREKFILAKVDGDDPLVGDTLRKQFHIRAYPTYLVLSPAGRERKRHTGFFPKADLLRWLNDSAGVRILHWPDFNRAMSVAGAQQRRVLVLILQSGEQIEHFNELFEEKVVLAALEKDYVATLVVRGNVGEEALLRDVNASPRTEMPEIIVLGSDKKELGRFFVSRQMEFGPQALSAKLVELAAK